MAGEVAREEHPGLDAALLEMPDHVRSFHAAVHRDEEAEPAGVRMGRRLRQDEEILRPGKPACAAYALEIGESAELIVRLPDGTRSAVNSGEVSVRTD